jgi:hyaluronan synthase
VIRNSLGKIKIKIKIKFNTMKEKKVGFFCQVIFFLIVYLILIMNLITAREIDKNYVFGGYSILITSYLLTRFVISYFYQTKERKGNYEPRLSFIVPAMNEEDSIKKTIEGIYRIDYPLNKIEVIAVNDGSTDATYQKMIECGDKYPNYKVVNFDVNLGKRFAMAEGVNLSTGEILIFVDSDSFIKEDSVKNVLKYFDDERTAAVTGHALVGNADVNLITKMQAARYYVAFRIIKAAESIFGSVTCCSGCFTAYRKDYLEKILKQWLDQKFMGEECTYGDDRALTNYLLKMGYRTYYAKDALVETMVPESFGKFFKQQVRWKKSWVRESLHACQFMWRRNPIMSISFYLGVILPLISPLVVFRSLVWAPIETGILPIFYLMGLILMSVLFGLFYYMETKDRLWIYGVSFALFYSLFLVWQMPYAILTLKNTKWGTR